MGSPNRGGEDGDRMAELVAAISAGKLPFLVDTADELVRRIDGLQPGLTRAVKWGRLTFALDGDYHHWLCAVGITRKTVKLSFHFGRLLDDPAGVLRTSGSEYLRWVEYRSVEDIDDAMLASLLAAAVRAYPVFRQQWEARRR
jgi:hypothetical protein